MVVEKEVRRSKIQASAVLSSRNPEEIYSPALHRI
jgi:hypothetical protein